MPVIGNSPAFRPHISERLNSAQASKWWELSIINRNTSFYIMTQWRAFHKYGLDPRTTKVNSFPPVYRTISFCLGYDEPRAIDYIRVYCNDFQLHEAASMPDYRFFSSQHEMMPCTVSWQLMHRPIIMLSFERKFIVWPAAFELIMLRSTVHAIYCTWTSANWLLR